MENKDIHNWLSDKEIRDFLGKELNKSHVLASIEFLEQEIKKLQEMLEKRKRYLVVQSLISEKGWNDFDISDEISYNSETYFPFIGTLDEYDELIAKIESEKEK